MVTSDIDNPPTPTVYVGCAGWGISARSAANFPAAGSHLYRYAQVFNAVEINSSFYRVHLPATYRRWAETVPKTFRFSVKVPRSITHTAKLKDCAELLHDFLGGVQELGPRLGCLLLQLPPRLAWNPVRVVPFLEQLRRAHPGPVACEPRHASWFHADVSRTLASLQIARVGADPALSIRAQVPAGARQLEYQRLHGSPRMYYDSYDDQAIQCLAVRMQRPAVKTTQRWCIFDNTTLGNATSNALQLLSTLRA